MALISVGWRLTVEVADNGGKPYGSRVYDLVDTDPTTVAAVATSIMGKLNAVTDSNIAGYTLGERFVEDALTLPASGVQNENQAIITCPVVGRPDKSATVTIPAANIGVFTNTSGKGANIVDMSDAALLAYLGIFDPTAGNEAYISDGEQLVAAAGAGKRRHTKNNNG
jgi:hypothetical protein